MSGSATVVLVNGFEDADDKDQETSRVHLFQRCFPDARVERIDSFEGRRGLVDAGHLRRMAEDLIDTLHGHGKVGDDDDGDDDEGGDAADEEYLGPIIFFAHNVGSALVKQVLLLASEEQQYQWIMLRTVRLYIFDSAHQDWRGCVSADRSAKELYQPTSHALAQRLPQAVADIELQFRAIDDAFSTRYYGPDRLGEDSSSSYKDPWSLCDGDDSMYNVCVDAMSLLRENHPRLQKSYHSLMRLLSGADASMGRLGVVSFDPAHTTGLDKEQGPYRKWHEDRESKILVISGPSGSGQTYLSSQILHRLSAAPRSEPPDLILSFAFDGHHIRRCSEDDFLRSILRQLLILRPVLFGRMRQIAAHLPRQAHVASSQLRDLLVHLLSIPDQPRVFLIVTGVDQCTEQQSIAALAERLTGIKRSSPIKILLSRTADLVDALAGSSTYGIDVDEADWKEAIRESASQRCRHIVSMRPVWEDMEDSIVNKLCSGSYTYFGVMVSLDQLERGSMPSTKQALSQLLMGPVWSLGLIFDSITEGIRTEPDGRRNSQDQESLETTGPRAQSRPNLVRRAINWVFHAVRPLSTTELAVALALEEHSFPPTSSDDDTLIESTKILAEGVSWDIIRDLGVSFTNMVKIVDDKVHLIHPKFCEYLQDKAGILIPDFDAFITEKLVSYVELFRSNPTLYRDDRHLIVAKSLTRYARLYWPEHYNRQLQPLEELDQRVEEFLSSQPRSPFITAPEDPLWIAAQMGFTRIVQKILNEAGEWSGDSPRLSRAAKLAAGRGQVAVLELLMKLISDDEALTSALNAASAYGQIETLRAVLAWAGEKEVELVARLLELRATNTLTTAVAAGHTEVIQSLLSEGFSSDHGVGDTAVHVASRLGNVEVLNILRAHSEKEFRKATILPNHGGMTPLHLACGSGVAGAYQLIRTHSLDRLDTGEEPTGEVPKDPLVLAAESGNLEIYESCRDAGGKMTPIDIEKEALISAAGSGHQHIVRQSIDILDKKLSAVPYDKVAENGPESQDNSQELQEAYRSAIDAAMIKGHLDILQLLLEVTKQDTERDAHSMQAALDRSRSADILATFQAAGVPLRPESEGETYSSWLDIAIGNNDVTTVRYLVEQGMPAQWDGSESSLHYAARLGREFCVREMLKRATEDDLQRRTAWLRQTPLEVAARWDQLDVCRELLKWQDSSAAGSDLPPPRPIKALIVAIDDNSEKVASYLLREKGWSARPSDTDEGIPLHAAATGSAGVGILRLLLDEEILHDRVADINAVNERGETALYIACRDGTVDKVKLLLDKGADQSLSDAQGLTPLHVALKVGREEVVRVLLGLDGHDGAEETSKPNIEKETTEGWRAIHYAVKSSEMTRMLLSHNPKPYVEATIRETEVTPLNLAAEDSSLDVVQQLLEAGADPNAKNHEGWTTLHIVMRRDDEDSDILRLLRRYGADPNAVDDEGRSPLYMAIRNDKIASALSLLEPQEADLASSSTSASLSASRADVKLYGGALYSPLHAAALEGPTKLVEALLRAGADMAAEGGDYGSVLNAALWGARTETVKVLLEHHSESHRDDAGADARTSNDVDSKSSAASRLVRPIGAPLHALYGSTLVRDESAAECAALLLQHGADVNARDYSGRTAVILAVCYRPDGELQGLLGLKGGVKIDVNCTDANGLTALHHAARSYSIELVNHLLEAGADPERRDRCGRTPLYYAASRVDDDLFQAILAKLKPESRREHMNEALMASLRASGRAAFHSILQEEDININRLDRNGWRALDLTHESVNPLMKETLEAREATRGSEKKYPTRLCLEDCDSHITLSKNGIEAWISASSYVNPTVRVIGAVRADYCIPMDKGPFYFEVEVCQSEENPIAVGIAEDSMPLDSFAGWEQKSWGYHGDDGSVMSQGDVVHTGPSYSTGKVVGVAVNPERRTLRFTLDGNTIGEEIEGVWGQLYPTLAFEQIQTSESKMRINFGPDRGGTSFKFQPQEEPAAGT